MDHSEEQGSSQAGERSVAHAGTTTLFLPDPPVAAATQARSRRRRLVVLGLATSCLVLTGVSALMYTTHPSRHVLPSRQVVPTQTPPLSDPEVSSFTYSVLGTGWTRYESASEGFSLELPSGWKTFTTDQLGPSLRFSASSVLPLATYGGNPQVYVMRESTQGSPDPKRYFKMVRHYLSSTAGQDLVGSVQMRRTRLRDGKAFILTFVYKTELGERGEMMYGLIHGGSTYRLVFVLPSQHLGDFEDLFHDIAMTFDVAA